jgi:hypothetical protein
MKWLVEFIVPNKPTTKKRGPTLKERVASGSSNGAIAACRLVCRRICWGTLFREQQHGDGDLAD